LLQLGRRYVAWVVAVNASIQPFFRSLQALLDHRADHFVLWVCAYFAVIGGAVFVERFKLFPGE
jgi:hypothetical protein